MKIFDFCLLHFLFFVYSTYANPPTVYTSLGLIEGFSYGNVDGSTSNVFLGIRYARAPVGELRFERPAPIQRWEGTYTAKHFPPACISIHESVREAIENEDCLFLNIITPSRNSSDPGGYPVLVFIHGGGFGFGSTRKYGYEHLSQNFVTHDIVVVTIQYRLGPFGFFSTGDYILPGNTGLWDQMFALHFLRQHLSSFGANPEKITVWGHSAGAASVSGLGISPHSSHLFQRGIQMSGSILSEWAMNDGVVEHSRLLAKELGCDIDSGSLPIHDCMKNKTVNEIIIATEKLGPVKKFMRRYMFHPRKDGEFFPFSPEVLMKESERIPYMIGVTDMEMGHIVHKPFHPVLNILAVPEEKKNNYSAKDLEFFIAETVVPHWETGREGGRFRNALFEQFVDRDPSDDPKIYLKRLAELSSDLMITVPVFQEVELRRAHGEVTYFFIQTHTPKDCCGVPPIVSGAVHSNELAHLFGLSNWKNFAPSEDDIKFKYILLDGFRNFVKTGDPSSPTQTWPTVTKEHPTRNLDLKPEPEIRDEFLPNRIKFWADELPGKVGVHILKKTRLPAAELHKKHVDRNITHNEL